MWLQKRDAGMTARTTVWNRIDPRAETKMLRPLFWSVGSIIPRGPQTDQWINRPLRSVAGRSGRLPILRQRPFFPLEAAREGH